MLRPSRLLILLSALLFAACRQDQLPTGPDTPAGNNLSSAAAATLVVNSLADPGDGTCNARECTLREAIKDSRSSAINFASGLTGTITLARPGAGGGTLVIDKTLTVTGPGARITITRRSTDPEFRLVTIGDGGTASLANLSLRNGPIGMVEASSTSGVLLCGTALLRTIRLPLAVGLTTTVRLPSPGPLLSITPASQAGSIIT